MTSDLNPGVDPTAREQIERRAASLLGAIEARSAYMWRESQRAIQAYFLAEPSDLPRRLRRGALSGLKPAADSAVPPSIDDLECYTQYWQDLLPADPDLLAVFAHLLAEKYSLTPGTQPKIAAVLRLDDDAVQASHAALYGESLADVFGARSRPAGQELRTPDPQEAAFRAAAAALEWIMVPSGETLYCAGDWDDALYAVVSGRLRVAVPKEERAEEVIAELGRGELVGLTEVISGAARADTVYAVRDSEVVRMPAEDLHRLADSYPQVWAGLSSILAGRLRAHLTGLHHTPNTLATFALLAAGPGAPLAEFTGRLVAGLAEYGSTLAIDSALVDGRLGKRTSQTRRDDLEQSRLVAWLSEQEIAHRYVVYVSDAESSAWSERCVREADRVLVLAEAASDAEVLDACLRRVLEIDRNACVELVLLHAGDSAGPAGTSRWLTGHSVQGHHHVRTNSEADLKRLVRRLTGHALGLVLGGGGARGWAHVGVWRALAEAGIEVDLLGGTSMGAFIGATLAKGLDEAEIHELAAEFSGRRKLFDPTLPIVSFFSTEKVTAVLQHILGDTEIEDLWRPFFAVATNVSRATQVVLTAGPLWEAVRASMAIPGIFAPMLYQGDVLVDGAVLNNLPTDVMERSSGGGPIVAVNVFPDVDVIEEYQFDASISGWEVLLKQINPLAESVQVPWLAKNLVRILSLNDVQQARAKRGLADVYIRPPVERFGILDFGAYDEIIEIGYETASRQIEHWLKTPEGARAPRRLPSEKTQVAPSDERPALSDQLSTTLTHLEDVLNKK